jgi:hypothetical protein
MQPISDIAQRISYWSEVSRIAAETISASEELMELLHELSDREDHRLHPTAVAIRQGVLTLRYLLEAALEMPSETRAPELVARLHDLSGVDERRARPIATTICNGVWACRDLLESALDPAHNATG